MEILLDRKVRPNHHDFDLGRHFAQYDVILTQNGPISHKMRYFEGVFYPSNDFHGQLF